MRARVAVLILTFLAVSTGALITPGSEALADDITIGVLVDLSGPNGAIGRAQRNSYLMARDEINAAGGLAGGLLQLDLRDTGGRPATARSVTKHFIENKGYPLIVGGSGSPVAGEAARLCQNLGIPYLVVSGAEDSITRRGYNYVFRLAHTFEMYQAGAVDFLKSVIDPRKVSLVHERSLFAERTMVTLRRAGRQLGWEVSVFPYDYGTDDFSSILARVGEAEPDVVTVISFGRDAASIVAGLRGSGIAPAALIGGSSAFSGREFYRAAGPSADGVLFVSVWSPKLPYPEARTYFEEYRRRFGADPDYHGAQAYSAIYVVHRALALSPSRKAVDIRNALAGTAMRTAIGPVRFVSEHGYTNQSLPTVFLQQWIDGVPEIVWPPDLRTAEPLTNTPGGLSGEMSPRRDLP